MLCSSLKMIIKSNFYVDLPASQAYLLKVESRTLNEEPYID